MTRQCTVDITPQNVGFDVRLHKMIVMLPKNVTTVVYDNKGKNKRVSGNKKYILKTLRKAGYLAQISPEEQ